MSNQFTIYSSTDASAPVLSGTAGSVTTLLDACLVNGYGSQAAAGWSILYTSTNQRTYQSGNNAACPSVLQILDTGTTQFNAVGGASATSNTFQSGIPNPFPTVAQQLNGIFGNKSNTASSASRPWFVIADNRTFYLLVDISGTLSAGYVAFYYGEMYSYKAASGLIDTARIIIGGAYQSYVTASSLTRITASLSGTTVDSVPEYMYQSVSNVGSSIPVRKVADSSKSNLPLYAGTWYVAGAPIGSGAFASLPFPTLGDAAMYLSPSWVNEPVSGALRGHLRGIQYPLHIQPLSNLDTFNGVGALAGRAYKAFNCSGGNPGQTLVGQLFIETSATLDTN